MPKQEITFQPHLSNTRFTSKYKTVDGTPIVNERVSFIPNVTIECDPPYIKGAQDGCWISYPRGQRPTTKEGWQSILGMSIQTMVD
jgi:hypothetical protein